jgi:hypothetical protein
MCHCTTDFDIRCRCTPYTLDNRFVKCPVRVDTAVWLLDNDEELHTRARERDFGILTEWFNEEIDIRNAELIYTSDMLEELGYDESEEALLWKQKEVEIRLRIIVLQSQPPVQIQCVECKQDKPLYTHILDDETLPCCRDCYM